MEERFRVGVISSVHGVHGECKVFPTTDDPLRYKKLNQVYAVDAKGNELKLTVEEVRFFKNLVIVKFKEITTPEEMQKIRGRDLMIDRSDAEPLAENEYYIADLIGLDCIDEDGNTIGKVEDIFPTGANLVVSVKKNDGKEALIPYVTGVFIKEVNIEEGYIRIHLIDGLI